MNAIAGTDSLTDLARAVEETRKASEGLRLEMAASQERHSNAKANLAMADHNIADLENKLAGWKRFRDHQAKLESIHERRIKITREELRALEDWEQVP